MKHIKKNMKLDLNLISIVKYGDVSVLV